MDVFSHGLWAGAAAKGINISSKKPRRINPWLAAFWGVFPDVFAFGISFVWLFVGLVSGSIDRSVIPDPNAAEPTSQTGGWIFALSAILYNFSHSLVIFTLVIGIVVFIKFTWKQSRSLIEFIPWEMGGWLLHIISDVPTHSYRFYPTPIFWPLSNWKFDGFSWGVWWFMLLNYGALSIAFLTIYYKKKQLKNLKN